MHPTQLLKQTKKELPIFKNIKKDTNTLMRKRAKQFFWNVLAIWKWHSALHGLNNALISEKVLNVLAKEGKTQLAHSIGIKKIYLPNCILKFDQPVLKLFLSHNFRGQLPSYKRSTVVSYLCIIAICRCYDYRVVVNYNQRAFIRLDTVVSGRLVMCSIGRFTACRSTVRVQS